MCRCSHLPVSLCCASFLAVSLFLHRILNTSPLSSFQTLCCLPQQLSLSISPSTVPIYRLLWCYYQIDTFNLSPLSERPWQVLTHDPSSLLRTSLPHLSFRLILHSTPLAHATSLPSCPWKYLLQHFPRLVLSCLALFMCMFEFVILILKILLVGSSERRLLLCKRECAGCVKCQPPLASYTPAFGRPQTSGLWNL